MKLHIKIEETILRGQALLAMPTKDMDKNEREAHIQEMESILAELKTLKEQLKLQTA